VRFHRKVAEQIVDDSESGDHDNDELAGVNILFNYRAACNADAV